MKRGFQYLPLSLTHIIIAAFVFLSMSCSREVDDLPDVIAPPTTSNIPLNNPDLFTYNGIQSGLYPWGNELIDNSYEAFYTGASSNILPLNTSGTRDDAGKVVVLAIGGSTPGIIFNGFIHAQQNDPGFGGDMLFLNGGINAMDFSDLLDPTENYWKNMDKLMQENHVTNMQVQVIFCIEDNLRNTDVTFQRAYALEEDYTELLNIIRERYPNCKLFLAADRAYSGYSDDPHHHEPIGYLNGWGVKLVVADYVNGLLPQYPVVNWLDYYWADGETPRWDGLTYSQSDFNAPSYVHLSQEKADELAATTHEKLKADPGASYWYK